MDCEISRVRASPHDRGGDPDCFRDEARGLGRVALLVQPALGFPLKKFDRKNCSFRRRGIGVESAALSRSRIPIYSKVIQDSPYGCSGSAILEWYVPASHVRPPNLSQEAVLCPVSLSTP